MERWSHDGGRNRSTSKKKQRKTTETSKRNLVSAAADTVGFVGDSHPFFKADYPPVWRFGTGRLTRIRGRGWLGEGAARRRIPLLNLSWRRNSIMAMAPRGRRGVKYSRPAIDMRPAGRSVAPPTTSFWWCAHDVLVCGFSRWSNRHRHLTPMGNTLESDGKRRSSPWTRKAAPLSAPSVAFVCYPYQGSGGH